MRHPPCNLCLACFCICSETYTNSPSTADYFIAAVFLGNLWPQKSRPECLVAQPEDVSWFPILLGRCHRERHLAGIFQTGTRWRNTDKWWLPRSGSHVVHSGHEDSSWQLHLLKGAAGGMEDVRSKKGSRQHPNGKSHCDTCAYTAGRPFTCSNCVSRGNLGSRRCHRWKI
jgi:hypothetical protein